MFTCVSMFLHVHVYNYVSVHDQGHVIKTYRQDDKLDSLHTDNT